MPIIIPSPIVVPPVPAKHADTVWILSMNVDATRGATSPVNCVFGVAPFVSSTGEILREQTQYITVPSVLDECVTNQKFAVALGAIYDVVDELCKQRNLFGMGPVVVQPTSSVDTTPTGSVVDTQPTGSIINGPVIPVIYDVSPFSIVVGDTVTIAPTVVGENVTFKWKKDSVDLVADSRISGVDGFSLTITNSIVEDSGVYTLEATNVAGTVTKDIIVTVS